ncbi:MAG: hypothetical protein IH861_00685 [Chloroflexi bacterium]|nr:hypothetical protein [Chloroflexota bacterium]
MVARLIAPIVDVSSLLLSEDAIFANGDLTGALGNTVNYHTVPEGQRWHLRWFVREIATGSSRVLISKSVANLAVSITAVQAQEQFGTFEGIIIDENDSVDLTATGNAGDGSISLILLFGRELLG